MRFNFRIYDWRKVITLCCATCIANEKYAYCQVYVKHRIRKAIIFVTAVTAFQFLMSLCI